MITCTCGKVIEKVPSWIASVNVEFVCNNCPNRQTKNIAFVSLEPEVPATATLAHEESEADEGTIEVSIADTAVVELPEVEPKG